MQVSILEGAFFDQAGNIRPSLPINMQPVIVESGFSKGYLRTAPGLTLAATGPGQDRGSLVWQCVHYRVMGSKLVSVAGNVVTVLGDVGNDGKPVRMDTTLAPSLLVYSAGNVFYWSGTALTQVQNPNIGSGPPIDASWIDGYTMMTDGTNLFVTNLADPTQLLPNAFEQPGEDPTPPVAVMRIRDQIYAITTNSIQNFQNVGGINFPFQPNPSGLIPKGAVGTHAVCYFDSTIAFVGNARNEAPSVYLAGFGTATPISTLEVDRELAALTPQQLAAIEIEGVVQQNEQRLYVHLPTASLVYHLAASQAAQRPIWTTLQGPNGGPYPARHFAGVGGVFFAGSPTGQIGTLDETTDQIFGQTVTGQFDTYFLYNEGKGAILQSVELVGNVAAGATSSMFLSWSRDGKTFSPQQALAMNSQRLQWRPKTRALQIVKLRFTLPNAGVAGFCTLQVGAEPLNA